MTDYYRLEICGLKRKLPIKPIGRKTKLASFSLLGDVELVEKIAKELTKRIKDWQFDYLVGPEVKVVPLIHELAANLKQPTYVICRKSIKPHMVRPITLRPLPHFPKHIQPLVIDGKDSQLIRGKKVVIVDDVVSTGVTMRMMKKMMDKVGAKVVGLVAAIRQGEGQFDELEDLVYLVPLPIIKDN